MSEYWYQGLFSVPILRHPVIIIFIHSTYETVHRIVSNARSKNDTKTVLKFNYFFFPDSFQNTSMMSEQLLFCIISIKLLTFEEKGNTMKIKFSLVYCCFCTKMQEIM